VDELIKIDYFKQNSLISKKNIEKEFTLSKLDLNSFQKINASLIIEAFCKQKTNLLISLPTNELIRNAFEIVLLIPILKCFVYNSSIHKSVNLGDIILKIGCGTISSVKAIVDENVHVLPILTTKRVELSIEEQFLIVGKKIKIKIAEIESRATLGQRQKGLENLRSKLLEEIRQQLTIINYYSNRNISFPTKHKKKIIFVASKKEFLNLIPSCIPFQYINKNGEIYPDTQFDPLLYVVNDFETAKEFIIDNDIEIDTIIFIGSNKYKSTTAITRLYRQEKFNRCIFVGTEDIESTDKFKVLKWNWTLPEIKYFSSFTNSNINLTRISHSDLSNAILDYIKVVNNAEQQNHNLINIKKCLRFIRKIYKTTALNHERIKSMANTILNEFEKEVKELFQDEYQSIDKDYKCDYELLKFQFEKIIKIVKNDNGKARWLKDNNQIIDYIVVPKSVKGYWQKEIERCLQAQQTIAKVKSLADLSNIQNKEYPLQFYKGLRSTQVITLREFEQKEPDTKRYLFLSFYGSGVYPETLLERMYAKNVNSEILLYDDEYKAFQYYLHKFNDRTVSEFRSSDREELNGIKYSDAQSINTENIDEWIKFLIDSDSFKSLKKEEIRYELIFEENTKRLKERESKNVYVEGYEERHKEIKDLKKGDKVRIYQNPDIEILHDIIKMTDENELFSRVDKFSQLWKSCLKNYLKANEFNNTINNLFEELVAQGLSVSKNQLENWLHPDNKTKFPKRKIDFSAIVKTVNDEELSRNWKFIMETSKEYLGTLNHKGRKFADEIDSYILTKDRGEMLNWLSDNHIEEIVTNGAPMRTIKEIRKLDYEIID